MSNNNGAKILPFKLKTQNADKNLSGSIFSPMNMKYLSEREAMSMYALIHVISKFQNVPMKLVRAMLEAELGLDDIHKLPKKDHGRAMSFLMKISEGAEATRVATCD